MMKMKKRLRKQKKNNNYSKPFSANNVSRNEIINTTKQLKTENNAFGFNRGPFIENKKIETKNNVIRNVSSKKNENKTPPKSQNSQRTKRAPSFEPKSKAENLKTQPKERNSKFKNKLFDDIENSKKIKAPRNFENQIPKKNQKPSTEQKEKSDHVNFILFKFFLF